MRDLPEGERRAAFEKMRTKMEEMTSGYDKKIDEVLTPAQRDKLNEKVLEQTVQFRGANGITDPAAAKALGLSEEQIKKLKEKAEAAQEKAKKLQEETEEDLLSVLSAEQREKVKKMIESAPQRGGRGPRGQGRGGAPAGSI